MVGHERSPPSFIAQVAHVLVFLLLTVSSSPRFMLHVLVQPTILPLNQAYKRLVEACWNWLHPSKLLPLLGLQLKREGSRVFLAQGLISHEAEKASAQEDGGGR